MRFGNGLQRYALTGSTDSELTREERDKLTAKERKLQDDQDERWRAYLLLKSVVDAEGKTELGRKAGALAIHSLSVSLSERFGRQDEVPRDAVMALSTCLRR